jgi:putative FmdB family regulatory protein
MPIYEYECAACGHQLEVIQKVSDEPLRICPTCGKEELKKLLSAPGFRLKGTGWYETDFKHGSKSKGDKAKGGATKPSGSDAGGGSGS